MTKLLKRGVIRKAIILAALLCAWELYGRWYDNPLMLPTFSATLAALQEALINGTLLGQISTTLEVLLMGYGAGLVLAAVMTMISQTSRVGADTVDLLVSMLNPIPSVAILPLALMWFGISTVSLVFVVGNAVVWPMTLNMAAGFRSVPATWRLVGMNYELSRIALARLIFLPGAFPQILAGLKISWAFAWRTLIASELVFGVSSGSGGIGWFILSAKNQLETASVFAGLLTVVLLGLATENLGFRYLEKVTVKKWGMSR